MIPLSGTYCTLFTGHRMSDGESIKVIELELLKVITLGQSKFDNINCMIRISKCTRHLYKAGNINLGHINLGKFDHDN